MTSHAHRAPSFLSSFSLRSLLLRGGLFALVAGVVAGCGSGGVVATPPVTPTLLTLSPSTTTAGSPAFALTVTGGSFLSTSQVLWNNSPRTTTVTSATSVTAAITAADVAAVGGNSVTVANGTSVSQPLTFTVTQVPNAVPTLTSITPPSALVGTPGLTITATGTNFITGANGTTLSFGGSVRATTVASSTSLTAVLTTADLAVAENATVTVTNPAPGGGSSGALTFTVNNALPVLTSISPAGSTTGATPPLVTLTGSGFFPGSTVSFGGVTHAGVTYVSATMLTVQLAAGDVAATGTKSVSVTNAGPGGGTSAALVFTVTNGVPVCSSLSPGSALAGSPQATVTVTGSGFVSSSVGSANGAARTTTYGSASSLSLALTATDLAVAGTLQISVTSPAPGGGTCPALAFTVNNAVPTLTSLSPNSALTGAAATSVTLTGTGFTSTSTVTVGTTTLTPATATATSLTVTFPASVFTSAGTQNVTVFTPTPGGGTSNALPFAVNNPTPTLTSVSPASALQGSTVTITLTGTGFVSGATVLFNGVSRAANVTSTTTATAVLSATDLATPGAATVAIVDPAPGGGTSNTVAFNINAPVPTLTSVSPNTALTGAAATLVTLAGTGFEGTSTVTVGTTTLTPTSSTATSLTVTFPASVFATAGTQNVTVFTPTPGGGTSNALPFVVNNPAPVATSLSPTSVVAGSGAFTLTISGSGFVANSTVIFNGVSHTPATSSATTLTVNIAAGEVATVGTFTVTVQSPTPGGGTSGPLSFSVNAPVPTITSLTPSTGTTGSASITVVVAGTGYISGSTVQVNATNVTTQYVSATSLNATFPSGVFMTSGTLSVTVVTPAPGGGTSNAVPFTVTNAVPTLTSVTPNSAVQGSTVTIALVGTNFLPGTTTLNFGGVTHAASFSSTTSGTATLTAGDLATVGAKTVSVTNPAPGGGTSNVLTFTVNALVPVLTSLNPASGLVGAGATSVVATGSGFTNTSVVLVNGTQVTTAFGSATSLTATFPASYFTATANLSVTVMTPTPGGGTSNAVTFAVTNPAPVLTSLTPSSAIAGGGQLVLTANGSGFVAGSTVYWNGTTALATTFVNGTTLTATVPAALVANAGSANVTVVTAGPGGGTSAAIAFAINGPVPMASSLSPSSATAGAAATNVTVNGSSFLSTSYVSVNGVQRATVGTATATAITIQLTTADLATAGTLSFTVTTPAPGGGTSAALTFTVNNPLPVATSLSPSSVNAGSAAFTLTVNGSGFVAGGGSMVQWNNGAYQFLPTTFVSATQLTASVPASLVTTQGSAGVTVVNTAPGGGTSASLLFSITTPAPVITTCTPAMVLVGSGQTTVFCTGSNFTPGSVVQVGGSLRQTTITDANDISAVLPATDFAVTGTLSLTVLSTSGRSNAFLLAVNNPVPVLSSITPASVTMHENPLTLAVTGSSFVAGAQIAVNGVTRTTITTLTGLATEITAADLNTAGSSNVTVVNPGPGGGPSTAQSFTVSTSTASGFSSCTDMDIGAVTAVGSGQVNGNGSVTVAGSGYVSGTADSFNYCYVPVQGNFQMIARVNTPTGNGINSGAQLGIMVRENTSTTARFEMIYLQAGNAEVGSTRRELVAATDILRLKTFNPALTFPTYIRLQRFGDVISLDYSYDGVVYQSLLSTQSIIQLNPNVLVGLVVAGRTSNPLTEVFDHVSLTPLVNPTQPVTDWYGNTFGGGGSWMIPRAQALATDASGNVYIQGQGEEESSEDLDTNGNFITYFTIGHFNTSPGVAYDPRNNLVWTANGCYINTSVVPTCSAANGASDSGTGGVSSSRTTDGLYEGSVLGSSTSAARTINSIAIYNNVMYALDLANATTPTDTSKQTVHTVSLVSKAETTANNFLVPSGASYITVSPLGDFWVLFTGTSPYAEKYTLAGVDTGVHMSGWTDPRAIATDAAGNVYISVYDLTLQQIFVYDKTGKSITTLGATGGLRSTCNGTTPGQYDPCKLDHPEGLTIDTQGNLYIASDGPTYNNAGGYGGMTLRKYYNVANNLSAGLSSANLAWHREGLMYIDAGAINPANQVDLYSRQRHFKMDYTKPAGQGWSLYGLGVDELAYPGDQRVQARYDAGAWFRTINGHQFIVSQDEDSGQIAFFLIQPGTEVQRPYATFIRETARGASNDASTIWVDTNLNGQVDTGETVSTLPPQAAPPSAEYLEYYVDVNGDVWTGSGTNTSTKVLHYKMTLLPNGYPTWSAANSVAIPAPVQFQANQSTSQTSVLREVYIPATDTMFLGGYTSAAPKPSSGYPVGALGNQVVRYDNFLGINGPQTVGCTINTPVITDLVVNGTPEAGTGNGAKAMDSDGALFAVEYDFSNVVTLYQTTGNCAVIQAFAPGPEVGGTEGTLDSENTLMINYRGAANNNEYLIFSEEGGQHKVIMYRYIYP